MVSLSLLLRGLLVNYPNTESCIVSGESTNTDRLLEQGLSDEDRDLIRGRREEINDIEADYYRLSAASVLLGERLNKTPSF